MIGRPSSPNLTKRNREPLVGFEQVKNRMRKAFIVMNLKVRVEWRKGRGEKVETGRWV